MTLMTPLAAEFAASAVFTPDGGIDRKQAAGGRRIDNGAGYARREERDGLSRIVEWNRYRAGDRDGGLYRDASGCSGADCCRVDAQVGDAKNARTRTGGIEGNAKEGDTVGCGRRDLPDDEVGREAVLEIDAASADARWCGSGGRGVQLAGAGRGAAGLIDQQYGIQREGGRGSEQTAGRGPGVVGDGQVDGDIDERNRGSRRGGKSAGAGEGDIADCFGKAFGADLRGEGDIRSKLQRRVLH